MINQSELETIDLSMTPPSKDVLSYSVSQNPVASELDGDSIDSSIQNALAETASNQSKKTPISIPVQELTPIERAVNEYAKINNARNKTALNQSLVSASAKDPDTAAKSQALATSLNVSTGVVDFDIELAKRQMLLRKAEAMKLAEKYPSLARSFLNQNFAEIAHDDVDNLAKTSDISRRLIATEKSPSDSLPLEFDPIRTANYYATNTLEGFKSDWERGYKSGDITDRSSKLGYSALTSPGSELRDAYIFQAENLKSKTEEYLGTWTESLAELAGQMAPMTVEAAATGVVASGGAALVASIFPPAELPSIPGAFAAGFAGSMSYQSYEIETGASYLDLRKGDEDYEPMSHEEAAAIAPTVGLINAVLETASNFFFFIPGAKLANYALKKTVKETVSKSLRKATVGKLARSAAVRVLKTGTLETVTEVLQTIVPKIVQEANVPEGRMSAFDTEEGRKRFADEIAVTIEKTFKGAFLLGLIPGGAKFIHERSILNKSKNQQEEITNLIDIVKESKVNKRSKPTYNSYLAQQLSGESLHIGVDQFEQIRKKSEVSLEELEKIIPGITEQVAKAKASGGDVVIPTSLYLSELIDTEFGVSIRNDIRADAEGMSINEIAESQEFLKELKSINEQAIEDFKKTNKDWAESAGKIEEEVFAKIKAAGNYTEEEARMLAQWHRDTAVVLASRFGMTPEQFNAKFGLSIESAYTPEQQAPAQGSFEQAAVRQTPMPSVTTTNPVSPIGLAIASIPANGPKSIADSNTFFKKVWKKLLIATGKQIRSKSDDSVKAAAKLAVADIQDFLKGNTQFLDYYSQDWIKTKQLLDNYAGRPITNDEFQMYRIISGLTSPNTKLPSNISDTVKLWTHWMNKGSFDDFLLGSKPITKTLVVFESAESVSGTTANVKVRTIKIVADLTKKLGSVKAAIDYLREPVTVKELHAINKTLGYAGNVSNIGNIRSLVQMATGQDTLIPRMFIFGQKVGAYALNSIGDERFTTVDIWESRYIRSFFSGMFENEIGLPVDEKEHDTFVRFGYAFKDEMERVTGRTWTPSSLQALRWFYIIAATRAAGYSKASTSETISTYTNRVLQSTFDYDQSRETNATKSITTPPRRIEPKKYERDIGRDLDAKGITDPKQRREYTAWAWIQFARSNRVGDEVGFQFDTDRSRVSRRSRSLSGLATVATHTPGVRLVDALTKAGVSAQPYVELEPTTEGTKAFSDLVRKVNANSKFGTAVYVYSDADYAKKRLFISESGKSGFALSSDGDIVSVFSESGSREGRGAMILATQMGGTKLDCFDTILPGYYAAHGFRAVARVPWNDEFIPAGWDFDAFGQYNGGRPDVVYMVYEEKYLKPYSNTDGVVVSNPDEATAIQTKDIKTEADRAATSKARYAQLVRPLDSGGYDGGVGSSQVLDQSAVPAAFYSALSVEVGKSATKSASADSWKQQIKGLIAKGVIKEREVFWSGLDNWLDLQEGKITKEQVQAFLAAGGVKVEVQQKSDDLALKEAVETGTAQAYLALQDADAISEDIAFAFDELEEINAEGGDDYRRGQLHAIIDVALNEQFGTSIDDYIEGESEGGGLDAPTKYSRYQLPGGTNYREALVTLPERARDISGYTAKLLLGGVEGGLGKWQVMNKGRFVGNPVLSFTKEDAIQTAVNQEMPKAPQYNTPHWDQNNVLVHLRMNDRVDADGKKVLFVEEVQSDWGQAGREKGFVGETISDKLKSDSKKLFDDTQEKRTAAFNALQSIDHLGFDVFAAAIGAIEESRNWKTKFDLRGLSEQEIKDISDFLDARSAVFNFHAQNEKEFKKPFNIPTAPFVETTSGWLELGLKQILLEAVNGGYDRVAFVDGDQSVERYRKALTEAVDEIEINKNDDATYTYSAIRGGATVQGEQSVSAKRIGEVFGKAGSKQLLEQADANPNDIHTISSEDIEIGGEGMRKFYDTIVPQALNKMLKKLGGDKVGEVEIDTRRPEDNAYYADLTEADTMRQQGFTVTPALAAQVNQGLPLFQSAQNKPARGFFNPKQLKMMLGSKSDFTTFIHELAHYNLTVLGRIASDPQSPSQIREDMDTTLSWFGIAGETPEQRLANWNAMTLEEQRRHHETFAYNHEIYLSEGKSPSIEMQGVFERFGQFIKRIYISIRDDLNAIYKQEFGTDLPMMTGEIRRVMDRMIATDEQIRSAEERRNMENTFRDQELSGMDDAQWASYQQMRAEATQKSVSELNEQSLAATTWASRLKAKKVKEIEAEQEELRSEIRKQVKKEVESRNVYRAIKFLKYGILQTTGGEEVEFTGSNKLNANAVKLMVPKENMDKFGSGKNGMVALDGYHPDIVSERFNYSSGDELILAILDAKPMDEVIDGITEDRMEIENGELNSPQAIEAAADKAVHNEARVKLVAVELRWLTKATQPVRAMIAAAKSVAKQMLETKRLRDIKPGDYASAAARAAKESQTAYFASQSAETAAKTAYTRHYNKMIAEGAEEAKAVEMATKVSDEALAKAESRSEAHKKKYGKMKPSEVAAQAKRSQLLQEQLALEANEAIDQVKKSIKYLRNVLSDKNVQKIGADNSDQIALLLERFELKNISLKEMDKRTSLADWIAGQLELGLEVDISKELVDQANKISYRNMTLSQFNDLVDAVKTIEYMGKNENAILTAAKKAVFKEKRDEIVKSIIENAGDRKASTRTPKSGTIGAVTNQITRFLAAHFKAASVVRILDGGKDDGPLWNYLIRSANKSGDKETTMRATATEAVSKILNPLFKLGKMGGKGKFFVSVNESLNREEKLVIALNMGNEGNIQRMLDGYGWTLEQVIPILESMTTEELNAVQEIWDHFETYKNEISAKSRRIYGKDLDFVEPTPIQIKSASGEIVSLRGGYYPAKYDPMASLAAENYNEAEKAKDLLRAAHISATTSRGYSKQRAAKVVDRPLIRNLSALYAGLNEVIHDLSWHEWTIDANKLMRDNAFDKEIRERYGPAFKNQLKSWIKDVAAGEKGMDTDVDIALNFLRQGVSSAGLGFNLTSAAIQVTGFNQSIVRVGPKYIGYGIMQVMKRGIGAFREVNELSEFMANRSRTQFRELNELRNRVQGQSAAMKRVRMGTYFLMMKMQRSVDVPTWIGAYAKQLEINPDEQLAIDIADQTVIDTQGGGQIKDLSAVERGGAGTKLFTVFYGYMNTVYNMAAVETMTEKKRGKLAADYVMLFVVPVVLSYALKKLLKPSKDDDDEFDLEQIAKDLSIEQIQYLMGTMVVAREFSQIAKTMIDPSAPSMGYGGPAGVRMIGDTYTAATQIGQGEFDSAFRKSAINLIGDATGLPSAQINRTIDGIEALMEDETTDIRAPLFGVRK